MANVNQELVNAEKMLNLWQDAERKLASGTVKSYTIGSRNLTYIDLKEVTERINYWENKIKSLQSIASRGKLRRARRFIPRDL